MLYRILATALLVPTLLACEGNDPVGNDDQNEDDNDSTPATVVDGTGTRYQSTGSGQLRVAIVDTVFEAAGGILTSSGEVGTSISSWFWDHEILATDTDTDSIAVHYEVVEGEMNVESFTGEFDVEEEWASDAWYNLSTVGSHSLTVGQEASFKLIRP